VIVEGEWGWIEEIGTTFVVVKIWDLRRIILPLSYFVEKPFQNWTHRSAEILGTVYLYTDYTVPIDELRAELKRLLEGSSLWLGKVCGLQVTDAKERTLELRALMDAPDSGAAWDLRCLVREGLVKFLQENYPQCLPKTRVEMEPRPESLR
jgi:small-conductance mechanosensitive channel